MTRPVGCLLAVLAVALASVALPSGQGVVLVAVHAIALVAAVFGVRRHHPGVPRAWRVAVAVLVVSLAAAVARVVWDEDTTVARAGVLAVQVTALGLLPALGRALLVAGRSRSVLPDVALTAGGVALVLVQVMAMLHDVGADRQVVVSTLIDITLGAVLLRLLATRVGTPPATRFVLIAWGLLVAISCYPTAPVSSPSSPALGPLQAAAVVLLAIAAQHPSMRSFGTASGRVGLRRDGQRLLTTLPVFCVVPALWTLGQLGVLPDVVVGVVAPSGYVLACAGVLFAVRSLRRAERSAERDPLTDLVNRRGLHRTVPGLRRRLHDLDVHLCLVDLDDFKQINDTRGHAVGDELLLDVSNRLREAVGADGVVSRTGGDEFLVVLGTSPVTDDGPGDRLLAALDAPFVTGGVPSPVSASIGIAPLPPGVPLATALVDADVAMYAAKQAGKGRSLVYRPQLREQVLGGLARQGELRRLLDGAPASEVGELVVVHQPVVRLDPVRVVGTEALVRWRHPRHGVLLPEEFLHHAESAGLGARLDEHVAEKAVAHLAQWDAAGLPPLHLAINLGVGSLRRHGTGRWVSALAQRHGITPGRLHLEITEHEELPDDPAVAASLQEVVAAGFQLDLDDFGIGYTSLSYLRRFPISTVKLDRSLTVLISKGGDVPLLQGIAALCHALDMRMLAEGVESPDQIPVLRDLGVEFAQGHHFGLPMSPADVPGFARRTSGSRADDALLREAV